VLLLGPLAATILLAVVFTLAWPLAAVVLHIADEVPYRSPVLVAAASAGGVLCVPGMVKLLSWGAVGLVIALVAAGVFVLIDLALPGDRRRRPRRRDRRRQKTQYRGLAALSRTDQLEDEKLIASLQCPLSIEELCSVWGETSTTLSQGAGPRDRQAVAEVRRICLDEFERRNPDGFQRWIEAGAPRDPSSYLLPNSNE
jgi:membrane-associated protease RseP (regulator of RpoE activity)